MDMMISQVHPIYFIELQKYQKALEQRNALLREAKKSGNIQSDLMDIFEEQMAVSASVIIPFRRDFINRIHRIACETYNEISGRDHEKFTLRYVCSANDADLIDQFFLEKMLKNRTDDIFRGTTSFGIHREDIQTLLNEKEMKLFASQGQIRTAALSMKLAQIDLFRSETDENPILLLDDVMSELDMGRRKRLVRKIDHIQTFITCTDESDLDIVDRPRTYCIRLNGNLQGLVEKTYNGISNNIIKNVKNEEPDFT